MSPPLRATFTLLLVWVLLTACGRSSRPTPTPTPASAVPGDATSGQEIFRNGVAGGVVPCATCHFVAQGKGTLVGPNLFGVGERAAHRMPETSAAEYLHESIIHPNAYVVEGFSANVMLQDYGQRLTEAQVRDLIAYLLSLK